MVVTDLVGAAEDAGLHFVIDGERIGLRGDPLAVKEWAPRLRRHKSALLAAIRERQAGVHRVWIIRPPHRAAFTVACPQGATAADMLNVWPGADVEPQP